MLGILIPSIKLTFQFSRELKLARIMILTMFLRIKQAALNNQARNKKRKLGMFWIKKNIIKKY